jgi:hypothetical protein
MAKSERSHCISYCPDETEKRRKEKRRRKNINTVRVAKRKVEGKSRKIRKTNNKTNSVAFASKRTIPTE